MKILGWVLIALVLVVAGIAGYAAMQPDVFRVERSVTVNAPAEKIYPLIEDFHAWEQWSPFFDKDEPDTKITYSGAQKGKGAVCSWSGKRLGAGSREITEATPKEKVRIKLDFTAPMQAQMTADFILKREGLGTKVSWANYGSNPFVAKLFGIFMSMDKMMGDDMQSRLLDLKKTVEAAPEMKK